MGILIVDDQKLNREILDKTLKNAGYAQVVAVASAMDAFSYLGIDSEMDEDFFNSDVDIILMDIMMPEIDGIEAVRRIRNIDFFKDLPIIMVTALSDSAYLKDAFDAGATDYITKPINKIELLARLKVALRLKDSLDLLKDKDARVRKELNLAKQLQHSVLTPSINDDIVEIDGIYIPCDELGGDMYAWYRIDNDRYAILLFDVVGHGVTASLISMSIRALVRGLIINVVKPELVVNELNKHMVNLFRGESQLQMNYFTAMYAVIDVTKKEITYVNAGHPPGIIFQNDEDFLEMNDGCLPIGVLPEIFITTGVIKYSGRLRMFIYTDGLIDILAPSMSEGVNRLKDYMNSNKHVNNQRIIKKIIDENIPKETAPDDICLISVTVHDNA